MMALCRAQPSKGNKRKGDLAVRHLCSERPVERMAKHACFIGCCSRSSPPRLAHRFPCHENLEAKHESCVIHTISLTMMTDKMARFDM